MGKLWYYVGIIICFYLSIGFYMCSKVESYRLARIDSYTDVIALCTWTDRAIKEKTVAYMQQVRKEINNLVSIKSSERTFENTAREFDMLIALSDLAIAHSVFQLLQITSPDSAIRDAAQESLQMIQHFFVDEIVQNKTVYNALQEYVTGNTIQNESLTRSQHYFLEKMMADFKRAGLDKHDKDLAVIKELTKEIESLCLTYERNCAQDNSRITVSQEDLQGLSADFIATLSQTDKGEYILGTDYPTYFQVMEEVTVEETRRLLMIAFANRAYPANDTVLKEIIAKRDLLAQLLGFESYAHYDLANQMVKSPERAQKFLYDLIEKARKKEKEELVQWCTKMPDTISLLPDGTIKPWDIMYLKAQYKKVYCNVDEQKIAEYFPLDPTLKALLSIYEQFLSLTFHELPVTGLWDTEVKLIEVYNKHKEPIGYLLLDLFPREHKYKHACHISLVPAGFDAQGNRRMAVSAVLANFPKPQMNKPSLLMRTDVNTFFHEFGHALHALLGATELASQAGTAVKRDFVEMPSQMLEEWLWNKDILKMISCHYQTGESLSDEQIESIVKLKEFDFGNFIMTQSLYSLISLSYFSSGNDKDPYAQWQMLAQQIRPHIAHLAEGHSYASFGHLTGYGAKYYGYLWSKVFALDMFEVIQQKGLLDPVIGEYYVNTVLCYGGSRDPNELIKNFLQREPNNSAFLKGLEDVHVLAM